MDFIFNLLSTKNDNYQLYWIGWSDEISGKDGNVKIEKRFYFLKGKEVNKKEFDQSSEEYFIIFISDLLTPYKIATNDPNLNLQLSDIKINRQIGKLVILSDQLLIE